MLYIDELVISFYIDKLVILFYIDKLVILFYIDKLVILFYIDKLVITFYKFVNTQINCSGKFILIGVIYKKSGFCRIA